MTGDRVAAAALLGVPPTAEAEQVRRAFTRAARHVHPDLMPDAPPTARAAAAAQFDRLARARDLLLQPAPPVPLDVPSPSAAPRAGVGFSLVLLALLGFLLIGLAGIEVALHS